LQVLVEKRRDRKPVVRFFDAGLQAAVLPEPYDDGGKKAYFVPGRREWFRVP